MSSQVRQAKPVRQLVQTIRSPKRQVAFEAVSPVVTKGA